MRWMTRLAIFARLCATERWPVLRRANLLNLLRDGLRVTRLTHSLEGRGRGLHSFTFQLNLSCFWHKIHHGQPLLLPVTH